MQKAMHMFAEFTQFCTLYLRAIVSCMVGFLLLIESAYHFARGKNMTVNISHPPYSYTLLHYCLKGLLWFESIVNLR